MDLDESTTGDLSRHSREMLAPESYQFPEMKRQGSLGNVVNRREDTEIVIPNGLAVAGMPVPTVDVMSTPSMKPVSRVIGFQVTV